MSPLKGLHVICRDLWKAWQKGMTRLINLRLARYATQSLLRCSTARHLTPSLVVGQSCKDLMQVQCMQGPLEGVAAGHD